MRTFIALQTILESSSNQNLQLSLLHIIYLGLIVHEIPFACTSNDSTKLIENVQREKLTIFLVIPYFIIQIGIIAEI